MCSAMYYFGVRRTALEGGRGDSYSALLVYVRKWEMKGRLFETEAVRVGGLYTRHLLLPLESRTPSSADECPKSV